MSADLEFIRKQYAFRMAGDRIHRTQEYFDEFDEMVREVRRAAWDQGYQTRVGDEFEAVPVEDRSTNPYA